MIIASRVPQDVTTMVYVGSYFELSASGGVTSTVKYYYAGGSRIAMRQNGGAVKWLLGDHLGSASLVYDGSQAIRQGYKAWGETRFGGVPTKYQYTGQMNEQALGLYYYGARWYDAALGRFMQADTIIPGGGNPQAWDRYAYVLNNPLRFIDPSGHKHDKPFIDGLYDIEYAVEHAKEKGECPEGQEPDPNETKKFVGLERILHYSKETGPITGFILQLPGSGEDWNLLATGLDILAWLTDLYASGAVTLAGFAGAALPAPLIAAGLPEVPLATGIAGMAIAELYIQPVLFIGNLLASLSLGATIITDTKNGYTIIEEAKFSSSVLNSATLTDIGWMGNEAYLSLTIQSIALANDFQWTSLPFPVFP